MVKASKSTTRESLHLLLQRMRKENEALQHLIDALMAQNKSTDKVHNQTNQ